MSDPVSVARYVSEEGCAIAIEVGDRGESK